MFKNIISLLLLVFVLGYQPVNGQNVPEQQRPLLGKVAATWCPPCGSWGWEVFENLVIQNEDKAVLIAAHHSGDLANDLGKDFSDNFNAPYQPYFYYNTEDQDISSSNMVEKLAAIKEKVDADFLVSPIANAGLLLELNGDDLTVTSKTIFFQEAEGAYYLGIYFVENEVIAYQASQGNNAVHEKILRGSISSGSFGEFLGEGIIESGAEFNHTFNTSISGMNVDHLEVITILWKKEEDTYQVVNTNISTDFQQSTSISEIDNQRLNLEVFPNIFKESCIISINATENFQQVDLNMYDINGKKVNTLYSGNLLVGISTFNFQRPTSIASGMYFLVFESSEGILTKSIIIE